MAKDPILKAIEDEAKRRSLADDGKTSHKERFRIRNELRAEAGLPPEKKKRGGVAGAWDRNKSWVAPVTTGLLGLATGGVLTPIAAGALMGGLDRPGQGGVGLDIGGAARGAASGAATGALGSFAGGFLPGASAAPAAGGSFINPGTGALTPLPASSASGGLNLGGMLGKAKDFALGDGGKNLLNLASGAYGVAQQAKGLGLMEDAARRDAARWSAGAPLRAHGMEGLLNPVPVDTSGLAALAGQGNPFARRQPVPGAGTLAGDARDERAGLQLAPMPATAMPRGR